MTGMSLERKSNLHHIAVFMCRFALNITLYTFAYNVKCYLLKIRIQKVFLISREKNRRYILLLSYNVVLNSWSKCWFAVVSKLIKWIRFLRFTFFHLIFFLANRNNVFQSKDQSGVLKYFVLLLKFFYFFTKQIRTP